MKLRQQVIKLKIPKSFDISKQLKRMAPWVEYWARFLVLIFAIVLAVITVTSVLSILPEDVGLQLAIFLNLFIIAAFAVFLFEVSHLFRRQPSEQQESTERPVHKEQLGRNRWALLGILALAAIILVPIFAKQRLPDPQEYQAFLTAFAATGAWLTGIALAVFAYQQYKLRQTEHSLLFNPQISISSGAPIPGKAVYNNELYPYRIEWATFIYNSSNIPVLIKDMAVAVRIANRDSFKEEIYLNQIYCTILEPESLEPPFPVTLGASQKIKWVIEGRGAGHEFEYLSDNSNSELFELIFRVRTSTPEEPSKPILLEHFSIPFVVPKNAPWGDKSPVLI